MMNPEDIGFWRELKHKFAEVLHARWFWILLAIVAALGVLAGIFAPAACHF